jgi:spermidine synthase
MKLTFSQKLRSYFYPVLIEKTSSDHNAVLDLYYYCGHWQLATADALYSDGVYYRPLLTAFKAIKNKLPQVKSVLVLGTGLGSAVQILHQKGLHPAYTLVELDEQVLRLALELMPAAANKSITPVCADAQYFLQQDAHQYDLLIVDIFNGRKVPEFVLSRVFIDQCRQHLAPQGILILNYMVNAVADEQKAKAALGAAFSTLKELHLGINRVYIATV